MTRYLQNVVSDLPYNVELSPIQYSRTIVERDTTNRIVMEIEFKVTCSSDYYGSDCNTYCVSGNDSTMGYYTCGSNGERVCRQGWSIPTAGCLTREYNQELSLRLFVIK